MSFKSLALAAALSLFAGGAALAAEACCCKEGEKMECCDKMKGKGADASKPSDAKPAQPEHQH
ncbi:hypothetical protein [Phenylobacterium sp.]|uniref:hypothetical protein n=1 Tax=Phenylobacterium sp. TaxID=1871053 RepID=UPI002EDA1E24